MCGLLIYNTVILLSKVQHVDDVGVDEDDEYDEEYDHDDDEGDD